MSDILTIAPIIVRRLKLPQPSVPRLAIRASLNAMFGLMVDALKAAYLAPYTSLGRRPPTVPDDDLKGRDPSW